MMVFASYLNHDNIPRCMPLGTCTIDYVDPLCVVLYRTLGE